jgi:hypothetical protein
VRTVRLAFSQENNYPVHFALGCLNFALSVWVKRVEHLGETINAKFETPNAKIKERWAFQLLPAMLPPIRAER